MNRIVLYITILSLFSLSLFSNTPKYVEIDGKKYMITYLKTGFNQKFPVVDRYGWKELSFEQQLDRAKRLGDFYNSWNGGPDYLMVQFARKHLTEGLF